MLERITTPLLLDNPTGGPTGSAPEAAWHEYLGLVGAMAALVPYPQPGGSGGVK